MKEIMSTGLKKRNMVKSVATILATVMLAAGMGNTAYAADTQDSQPPWTPAEEQAYELEMSTRSLEVLFNYYESIPDGVLEQGDPSLQAWQGMHPYGRSPFRANFWGCAAAVAGVIASTAFPAAKILKVKKLIKALGGVKSAIKIMAGASFSYEKMRALGGAAAALAAELTGIGAVRSQCFA